MEGGPPVDRWGLNMESKQEPLDLDPAPYSLSNRYTPMQFQLRLSSGRFWCPAHRLVVWTHFEMITTPPPIGWFGQRLD